jgi:hypothetical protein
VAFAAVARRAVDVVRLPLAMIRSPFQPSCGQAWRSGSNTLPGRFMSSRPFQLSPDGYMVYVMARASTIRYTMKPPTTERLRLRRPKGSGQYPVVPVRLPPDLLVAIDKLAAKIKSSRSEAVRLLIEAGLKRRPT